MRLLVFTCPTPGSTLTGRELLAALNREVLQTLGRGSVWTLTCVPTGRAMVAGEKIRRLFGWLDGLTPGLVEECLHTIRAENIDTVYLEGSNYGRLARIIKREFPECTVITFFHNVESRFFLGALKSKPSVHALGVLLANTLAERWTVRYSDRLICLTRRDSELLAKLYGRSATHISPLCLAEPPGVAGPTAQREQQRAGLFVGGAFYANVDAVLWFARNVSPKLPDVMIYVVGRGFEQHRNVLETHANIKVIGQVDDLSGWYSRCQFVLAPIFDGSGMKTKVAEALMHGRPVIGTAEAFVGYEDHAHEAGITCRSPDDFVSAVIQIVDGVKLFDEEHLKDLYKVHYSKPAALRYMAAVLSAKVGSTPSMPRGRGGASPTRKREV